MPAENRAGKDWPGSLSPEQRYAPANMSLRTNELPEYPGVPLLQLERPEEVAHVARERGWIASDHRVTHVERAGEGNMNLTLRLVSSSGSVIVKQSRPWVEKYDSIAAPFDRALVEQAFYRRVRSIEPVAERMPALLMADAEARVLVLEDLGEASDLSSLYGGGQLSLAEAHRLGAYLAALHEATRDQQGDAEDDALLRNREMRALNHEHIFVIPLAANNGLDLDGIEMGLAEGAASLRADEAFCEAVESSGRRYLADGPCLLHGDFFPGSWVRTGEGLYVIDPEFCFFGDPEFDLGVAVAHFAMAGQPLEIAQAFLESASTDAVDQEGLGRIAGIETMRRLIGVAQLPLAAEKARTKPLELARVAVLESRMEVLFA